MIKPIVILFLIIAGLFAFAHTVAVELSLYWYYWWFDSVMHFWGGLLIALGVFALSTFRRLQFKPTLTVVFAIALGFVVTWEIFEWIVGLFNPATHVFDTAKDILLGLLGSVIGYSVIRRSKY